MMSNSLRAMVLLALCLPFLVACAEKIPMEKGGAALADGPPWMNEAIAEREAAAAIESPLDSPWYLRVEQRQEGLAMRWHNSEEPFAEWLVIPSPLVLDGTPLRDERVAAWYRTRFPLPEKYAEKRLRIGGLGNAASVWLNDQRASVNAGTVDLSLDELLSPSVLLNLVIRVETDGKGTGVGGPIEIVAR